MSDAPYEPPFTLPDYKEVGFNLMRVARSYVVEQDKQNIIEFEATFGDSMSHIVTFDAGGIELPLLGTFKLTFRSNFSQWLAVSTRGRRPFQCCRSKCQAP